MKILLSNHGLNQYGGSETWVYTMFRRLSYTHEVHVYTPGRNSIFPEMPPYDPAASYDLGILNHLMCLRFLRDKNIKKIIYTSHGVIPGAEKPGEGADVYVSVSEEVQTVLAAKGFDSVVIRNPIDTERFKAAKPSKNVLRNVAYISNNPQSKVPLIKRSVAGLKFETAGRSTQQRDVRPMLNRADLVIGLGRTAYEAMSMGRNVVVFDYKGADGFVTPKTILDYRLSNCSGRHGGFNWDEAKLREAVDLYDPLLGPALREYIIDNNNVDTIVEQYLSL